MIDSLLNSPTTQMLEQSLNFTEQRHEILLADIANADTPGYVQTDVSVRDFQKSLRNALDSRRSGFDDDYAPESSETVAFESSGTGVTLHAVPIEDGTPFHDRTVQNMEKIQTQFADNALSHNILAQFLKSRYDTLNRAISMRV